MLVSSHGSFLRSYGSPSGVIVTPRFHTVVRAQHGHVRPEWAFSGCAFQRFFKTPDFQREVSLRGFQLVDYRSDPMPTAFFVESCSSLVSDGACEPSRSGAALRKASLSIGNQRGCDTRSSRWCRDVELIELVALNDAKSKRLTTRTYDSHIRKCCLKSVSETL